ncbi:MAG: hypothetical protein HC938_16785 [Nitrospira sp.]|nr:hypothetical protein [Nitrospira sp.]
MEPLHENSTANLFLKVFDALMQSADDNRNSALGQIPQRARIHQELSVLCNRASDELLFGAVEALQQQADRQELREVSRLPWRKRKNASFA